MEKRCQFDTLTFAKPYFTLLPRPVLSLSPSVVSFATKKLKLIVKYGIQGGLFEKEARGVLFFVFLNDTRLFCSSVLFHFPSAFRGSFFSRNLISSQVEAEMEKKME